jgi:glycosyltransferase involved in cell wall biosynthesis
MTTIRHRLRIFAPMNYYAPGFHSGGPIQSVVNLVQSTKEQFEFFVVTHDHEFDESVRYAQADGEFATYPYGNVCYLPSLSWGRLIQAWKRARPEALYLNSLVARLSMRVLIIRRLMRSDIPVVIAPRGELSAGALSVKPLRKRLFLIVAPLGFYRNVTWQATSPREYADIRAVFGAHARIREVTNIAAAVDVAAHEPKSAGSASFLMAGRIAPKKNLTFILRLMREIRGSVTVVLAGAVSDPVYWAECQRLIGELPANVTVRYVGAIPRAELPALFAAAHFFVSPTLDENFGHAILEALSAGCPALISDCTPWLFQGSEGGWALPLDEPSKWRDLIQGGVDMAQDEWERRSRAAEAYGRAAIAQKAAEAVEAVRDLFSSRSEPAGQAKPPRGSQI